MFYNWLIENYVEVIGVVTSLIYLYFSVRQIIWLWPFGILSSAIFIWIFLNSKFYADMGLQFYYLAISIYGWIYWMRGSGMDTTKGKQIPVTRITRNQIWLLTGIGIVLFLGIVAILKFFTDSDVPWGDGFTTAASVVATWMLARKILEHWLIWILVDLVAAGLYFYKGLHPSFVLYIIYAVIAVLGYIKWKSEFADYEGRSD
ncbi:nicotinamide riboside transporter PnuC [Bacteroidota bacterium]